MTNVAKIEGLRGPMGEFVSAREYPSAAFKDVTAPNADTLYSSAWLDSPRSRRSFTSPTSAAATT